jgi:multidrug resistance protein, MATE family
MQVTRRAIVGISWPIILSNLSTPLLGLVDTAVVGNLGDPALIGAIAVGGMIFSFLYWGFGFLRMGTTALVAQARGAGDVNEVKANLYRPLAIGLFVGMCLVTLQVPLGHGVFLLIDGSDAVESAALSYFQIRILAAPISLANLVIAGFLLGQQQTRTLLGIQLILNGTNILLDFLFVVAFDWGITGVASATVIAECLALVAGSIVIVHGFYRDGITFKLPFHQLLDATSLKRLFTLNRDIMIRTLCLIFAFAWFTNQGAKSGDVILAANAILMQFVTFSAFFLDGFALSAEILVGHAIGSRDRDRLDRSIKYCTQLGIGTAILLSIVFVLTAMPVVTVLTNVVAVQAICREFLVWVVLAPPISVACYILDGIFIGATRSTEMRNAMVVSLAVFLGAWYLLHGWFGNHGLWAALMLYYLARAGTLYYYLANVRANFQ